MRDGWSLAEARAKDSELMFKRSEDLAVNELEERLNDLLHPVKAVTGNRVDCVQHGKDDFKRAKPDLWNELPHGLTR